MNNGKWHQIWNNRTLEDDVDFSDEYNLYRLLKRADGFDTQISDSDKYYREFYDSIIQVYEKYMMDSKSAFEVGCGSGANLYLLKNRGMEVDGVDYSKNLCDIARRILKDSRIEHDEAINLDTTEQYDLVMSDSVFAYFPNEEYAQEVLKRMIEKARKKVILLEILDKERQEECIEYRRRLVPDYDKVYEGLDKMFFSRGMFINVARENQCEIEFSGVTNKYYWNSDYMYNVVLKKSDTLKN